MPYPQFSFSQFVQAHCLLEGAPRNATTGLYEPTVGTKANAAQLLTLACEYAWQDWSTWALLPSITESATVTPSSHIIAWADLQYTSKWSLWTTDPRTSYENGDTLWETYRRKGVQHANGVLVVDDPGTTMTAFYQKAVPKFTHTNVVSATTYAAGDLVWDGTDGTITTAATGHCYLALGAHLGSEIADTAKWRVQSAPEEMRQALIRRVAELRLNYQAGQQQTSRQETATAESMIEDLYQRHTRTLPPWFIHNGGLKS